VRDGYRPGDGAGPRFVDYLSDIVVFTSADGLRYEYGYVLASAGIGGTLSFEDPRVQWLEDRGKQRLVMTYTQVPPPGDGPWRIGAHHLHWDGKRFEIEEATGQLLGPPDAENKDAVVFTLSDGHVALIHHFRSGMQLALFDNLEHLWHPPEDYWDAHPADLARHTLLDPLPGALSIGVGAPPVRSEAGSSCFFHERRAAGSYTMNLALLDETTGRVRSRLPEPVLEPELDWERAADVNDVMFVQGAHCDGDDVYLTYGAADRCVGAAVASVPRPLDALAAAGRERIA
jgi:predicted GH43/DUF377 family glycosyl hydrolase